MKPAQSPFPLGWWGTALDNVGLQFQRPLVGTYGCYDFPNLPELPVVLDGAFGWLTDAPLHEYNDGSDIAVKNTKNVPKLIEACKSAAVALPASFLMFIQDPDLEARIRSNTCCYFDYPDAPVRSPLGNGHLVRFLADSQRCIIWYLYIPSGTTDHAVVASPVFFDSDEDLPQGLELDSGAVVFSAESFEAFICRFWIENELWFSEIDNTRPSNVGQEYLERYRLSPPDPRLRDFRSQP
jgi:hypothetical protein